MFRKLLFSPVRCNSVYCVSGHDPLTFSFQFLFLDWVGVLWPQLSEVLKLVHWASASSFPNVPAVAGRQLILVQAAAYVSDSVSSYFSMACYSIVSY